MPAGNQPPLARIAGHGIYDVKTLCLAQLQGYECWFAPPAQISTGSRNGWWRESSGYVSGSPAPSLPFLPHPSTASVLPRRDCPVAAGLKRSGHAGPLRSEPATCEWFCSGRQPRTWYRWFCQTGTDSDCHRQFRGRRWASLAGGVCREDPFIQRVRDGILSRPPFRRRSEGSTASVLAAGGVLPKFHDCG